MDKQVIQTAKEGYIRQLAAINKQAEEIEAQVRKLRLDAVAYGGAIQACDQLLKNEETTNL